MASDADEQLRGSARRPRTLSNYRHDLRTPIGHIIGFAELLEDDFTKSGNKSGQEDTRAIVHSARQLLEMLEEFFDWVEETQIGARESLPGAVAEAPRPASESAGLLPSDREPVFADYVQQRTNAPGRVLIVDDNKAHREMVARFVALHGFAAVTASGGEEALALLERESFDVVLLDIVMNGMSGFETLTRIRETASPLALPVLVTTGLGKREHVLEALRLGANDHIAKPLDSAILLARLNTQLLLKRSRDPYMLGHDGGAVANPEREA